MREGCAADIRLNEALPFGIYDLAGKLLLGAGTAITTQAQFDRLVDRGFLIGDEAGSYAAAANEDGARGHDVEVPVFLAIRDIAHRVQGVHNHLLQRKFDDVKPTVEELARQIDTLVRRDVDAALASMQLHMQEGDFGSRYVHAAVLCWLLGRAIGHTENQLLSLLEAALVYDVALTPMSKRLNNQREPLTAEQREEINAHPQMAHDLLKEAGFTDCVLLNAVLEHHERLDGSGYPRGLKGDEISVNARILGIVDSFSAMVRPRVYREAVHSKQALRDIFIQRSKSADERLVNVFIKEVGMYSPGSVVKLTCGDIAVVFRRGDRAQCPIVRVLLYANGGRALAHPLRDTCDIGAEVVEGLPARQYASILGSINHLWLDRLAVKASVTAG